MEITNDAYESLIDYFKGLSHTGYKSYNEVYQLLAMLFMEEILYGPLSWYVTDSDYKSITNAMYCLYGSCLMPYPTYLKGMEKLNRKVIDNYRITEEEILRSSDNSLRAFV